MVRRILPILLALLMLTACGQKGPLVLPEEARRKAPPPASHDVPPTEERKQ